MYNIYSAYNIYRYTVGGPFYKIPYLATGGRFAPPIVVFFSITAVDAKVQYIH